MRRLLLSISALALALAATLVGPLTGASGAATVFPRVKGGFGQTPKITFPSAKPTSTLGQDVLHHGSGPQVKKGDLLLVNYVGQIWKGKVFDSSFARDPGAFPIGVGLVIPAWDSELVKDHVGDRVLLVVPPKSGYGSAGYKAAGITGTDTIVFVIDIRNAFTEKSVRAGHNASKVSSGANGITVSGALNAAPKVSIAKSAPKPKTEKVTVLDKGHGKPVTAGVIVLQLTIASWTGQIVGSTWSSGSPTGQTVKETSEPGAFDEMVGIPLGSRVLIEVPKDSSGDGPYALVADLSSEPYHGKG